MLLPFAQRLLQRLFLSWHVFRAREALRDSTARAKCLGGGSQLPLSPSSPSSPPSPPSSSHASATRCGVGSTRCSATRPALSSNTIANAFIVVLLLWVVGSLKLAEGLPSIGGRAGAGHRRWRSMVAMPVMGSKKIVAGLRQLVAVLVQAAKYAVRCGDVAAVRLHVTTACLLPRSYLSLHLVQVILTCGGQLAGVLLETGDKGLWAGGDVRAQRLNAITETPWPWRGIRAERLQILSARAPSAMGKHRSRRNRDGQETECNQRQCSHRISSF
jgi:hypothetical protein